MKERLNECHKYAEVICADCREHGRPLFNFGSGFWEHRGIGRNGESYTCSANAIWKCFERMFGRINKGENHAIETNASR